MPYPPLVLVKRLPLSRKMTPAEMDQNLTDIETGVNAQRTQLNASLNPDGTLKDGAVSTNAIQNRAVTQAKLDQLYAFYAVDSGSANAIAVAFTPAFAAYAAGMVIYVKVAASCTGATTLNMDGVGGRAVKKSTTTGLSDLESGDVQANGIYEFVDDGTQWILENPTPKVQAAGTQFLNSPVVIYSGGAVAFPGSGGVPFDASPFVAPNAKGIIVQWELRWGTAVDGESRIETRTDPLAIVLMMGRVGGVDGVAVGGQSTLPLSLHLTSQYRVTETQPGVTTALLTLVGYVL